MIGVEPATHELVLWGLIAAAVASLVVGAVVILHAQRNHKRLAAAVTELLRRTADKA